VPTSFPHARAGQGTKRLRIALYGNAHGPDLREFRRRQGRSPDDRPSPGGSQSM